MLAPSFISSQRSGCLGTVFLMVFSGAFLLAVLGSTLFPFWMIWKEHTLRTQGHWFGKRQHELRALWKRGEVEEFIAGQRSSSGKRSLQKGGNELRLGPLIFSDLLRQGQDWDLWRLEALHCCFFTLALEVDGDGASSTLGAGSFLAILVMLKIWTALDKSTEHPCLSALTE